MEINLRCNVLTCRRELNERAVVTTCLHIYCMECTESRGLAHPPGPSRDRLCPACNTPLQNPDDVVSTFLNPTDDYKQSVLSGLDPATIAECATRGLGFWQYQMTQEVFYQAHLSKGMTDKLGNLNGYLDKIIDQANGQITTLNSKLSAMESEQENLVNKNNELVEKIKESGKRFQLQKNLYNKLKAQTLQQGLQEAALHNVDLTAQSISDSRTVTAGSFGFSSQQARQPQPGSATRTRPYPEQYGDSNMADVCHRQSNSGSTHSHEAMPPPGRPLQHPRLQTLHTNLQSATPQHRERLGVATLNRPAQRSSIPQPTQGFLGGLIPPSSANRQRFGATSGHQAAMSPGSYGLSAGARFGRATGPAAGKFDERLGRDFSQGNPRDANLDPGPFSGSYR